MPALVAIIGRPNVGKSTLFNRILGKRIAIESPISGTTRDPVTALYNGSKVDLLFVDTGGLEFGKPKGKEKTIEENVQLQARMAIEEADLVLFCVDTKQPLTSLDKEAVSLIRKKAGNKPVLVVGTKYEGKKHEVEMSDLLAFGLGEHEPVLLSAFQSSGIWELIDMCESILKKRGFQKDPPKDEEIIHIAVLGRPNVGKSSLINAITNTEKLIVSDIAGTTRDSVDMDISKDGQVYRFMDTAGIRRKSKVDEGIEKYSIMRTLARLFHADVTILLIDPQEGVTHQDKYIIEQILEAKTGLLLLVNKWDLEEKGEERRKIFLDHLKYELGFIPWAPVLFVSALKKRNIHKIFPLAEEIKRERAKRIPTGELNSFLMQAQNLHPISGIKSAHPRIKFGTQVDVNPPHFVFKGARLDAMHFSSRRYLENRIRDVFGFVGTPIQIEMSTQKNPYLDLSKRKKKKKNQEE